MVCHYFITLSHHLNAMTKLEIRQKKQLLAWVISILQFAILYQALSGPTCEFAIILGIMDTKIVSFLCPPISSEFKPMFFSSAVQSTLR